GWPVEAYSLLEQDRPLTELNSVGPFIADRLLAWLRTDEPPPLPEQPFNRRNFLTRAQARRVVAEHPQWSSLLRADFQMHTLYSDGHATVREMVAHCIQEYGYSHGVVTDHSSGLAIANGMDEAR